MAQDIAGETEKQLKWLENMYEKMRRMIAELFKKLLRLLGKGIFWGGKTVYENHQAVGQRKGDKSINSPLNYDILQEYHKSLETAGIDHNFSFIVDGEIIDTKNKQFEKINEEFKEVANAKDYNLQKNDELIELNEIVTNWKISFKNRIKFENPERQKVLLDLTETPAQEIKNYRENPESSKLDQDQMYLMETYGIDKFILDKEKRDDLKHDIEVSNSLSDLRDNISLEKVNDEFDFEDKINLVKDRYNTIDNKIKSLSTELSTTDEKDTEKIEELKQEIELYENDPIFKEMKGLGDEKRDKLFNDKTYTYDEDNKFSSKDGMKQLLVDEYKYGAQQYRDKEFAEKENETFVNNAKMKTKFLEKYNYMPKDLQTDRSTVLVEHKDTVYDLNGKPIEGVKGGTYDVVSNQKDVVIMTHVDKKTTAEAYNYAVAESTVKAQQIMARDEELATEKNPQRPNESKEELENSLLVSGLAEEINGNVSNYEEFIEHYNSDEVKDNAIVQFQIGIEDAKTIKELSNYLESQNKNSEKTAPYMIKNNSGKDAKGPISGPKDFVFTMPYSTAKKAIEETKRVTGKDVNIKRGRVISRNKIESIVEKDAESVLPNHNEPINMKFKDANNTALLMSAGYAVNNDNAKNETYISIESRNDGEPNTSSFVAYNGSNDKDAKPSDNKTQILDNPSFVEKLTREYRDQIKYNDMGSVENNLAFCKEEAPRKEQRNIQEVSVNKENKDKKEYSIENNDRNLKCLVYDRKTKSFVKDEKDEYSMIEIDKDKPIETENLSEGKYILVPYQEYLEDEDKTLQAMELNPSLGNVEDELEEGNPEMYITEGYSLQVEPTENVDEKDKNNDTKTVEIASKDNDDKGDEDFEK